MQTQSDAYMGQPYRARMHFMDALCARAEVKPFGFHAIRHKSAAITFVAKGLSAAQILMGHSRATTTDIYVRSAGLYADQGAIQEALSKSVIDNAVSSLVDSVGQSVGHRCAMQRKRQCPWRRKLQRHFVHRGMYTVCFNNMDSA